MGPQCHWDLNVRDLIVIAPFRLVLTSLVVYLISGVELQDDLSLADCGIQNGATLKLVLSMRGGPINTRRIAMPPPKQQQQNHDDLHNLMMRNKAQILEKIPANGQVFKWETFSRKLIYRWDLNNELVRYLGHGNQSITVGILMANI